MLGKSRVQAQDVVAFARTTSVRTEMGCYSGDAGMKARQEAGFGSEIACTSHRALKLMKARLPGQRELTSADRLHTGIADLTGGILNEH